MSIRIVTDSTCDLPGEVAQKYGIKILPTYVNAGDQSWLDGVDLSRDEFYERLPSMAEPPTTAAPAVGTFKDAYESLAKQGATAILSIHLASSLSGLLNSAHLGAEAAEGVDVTVFDSRQVSMGLGFLALEAARMAAAGESLAEITAGLKAMIDKTHVLAVLDTLEYLRRSGRVSWAEFGLGTLLRIKPMVHVHAGTVNSLDKVRTRNRALDKLLEHASDLGPLREIALLHTAAPEGAKRLGRRAKHLYPAEYEPLSAPVTPTIGAHVGPGALGIACVVD